jgi:hypothetical protein
MGQVLNISYLPSMTSTPLRAGHHREPVRRPSGRRSGGSDLAVFGTEVPTRGCQLEYFGHGPSISAKYLEYFGHGPSISDKECIASPCDTQAAVVRGARTSRYSAQSCRPGGAS